MPLKVEFPDGIEREVPSHKRVIKSQQTDGKCGSGVVEEPDFNPQWRFQGLSGGRWLADHRD